ncbi:MAG: hypothetical protein DHS20C08_19630 [Rhodomicrobium sp.]|nr:MAG: hypothetical protein DHS20C08_19630 [Rhodomicrobium sp.]
MLEQGLQTVHRIGKQNSTAYSDTKESASAYEALEAQRQSSKESKDTDTKGFQIEKRFSTSSKELARTLGSFHKILEVLERPEDDASEALPPKLSQKELFGKELPPVQGKQTGYSDQSQSNAQLISDERQLEFDFEPEKKQIPLPSQGNNLELGLKRFSSLNDTPDIDLGINPSKFKIQNIITDEIIKAISTSNQDIEIKNLGEPVATKLANHVRKLLEKQPHALATTKDTAPVKAFDTLI